MTKKKVTLEDLLNEDFKADRVRELQFEEGLALLEELVGKVESGSFPLESALQAYERGVTVISHLRSKLSGAEEKLKKLQRNSEGEIVEGK